jgi:peptide/nickel transport system substrate-binding protein
MTTQLDKLRTQLAAGMIGRRQFIKQAAAVGAVGAIGAPFAGRVARAAAPSVGGDIRIGLGSGSTSDSMDPAGITDTFMQVVNYGLRNNLTEVAPSGELIPELAESYEASPDAKVWTFKLRQGIEFHNGKTMTADDVIASIDHHRGEKSDSGAKGILKPITAIKKDGDYTVVFELDEGNADFPYLMSDYHLTIMPLGSDGLEIESGVGTGGYILTEFEPGVRCKMKRNPNYWKEGAGFFETAEVLSIKDSTSRTNALTTGEIHVMNRVDPKVVNLVSRRPGIGIVETSGNQHYTMPMHTDKAPFNDNHVRMALKLSMDRQEVLDKVLNGHGYLGNDHPIGKANRFYAEDLPQRAYDSEKAKWHLKQAGMENLSVDLSSSEAAFVGATDAAVLFKEQAQQAGISVNVKREPSDGYWSDVWLKEPFCMSYWGGRPTEDWMFQVAYAAGASWNATNWEHERFNKLLQQARAELDTDKRASMYKDMQQILRNDGGVIIPMFANYIMGLSEDVQHGEMAANWDLDGLKCLERWWMA